MPYAGSASKFLRRGLARVIIRVFGPIHHGLHQRMLLRSSTLLEAGRPHDARRWAAWATNIRSTDPEAWYLIALAQARKESHVASIEACEEALGRDPGHARALALRAAELIHVGQPENAPSAWYELLPDHPDLVPSELRHEVARLLAEAGCWAEVLSLARYGSERDLLELELEALEVMERFDEMWELMVASGQQLEPGLRARIWYSLNVRQGKLGRAWWWIQQVSDSHIEPTELLELGRLFEEAGDLRTASECIERSLRIVRTRSLPTSETARPMLVEGTRRSLALGLAGPAEGFARALAESFPDHPWSWLWLGRALRAGDKLQEAWSALETSVSLQTDLFAAWEELTRVLKQIGAFEESQIAANRRLLTLASDRPRIALKAIFNLVELGDHDHARRGLDALLEGYSDDPDVMAGTCRILDALDEKTEADAASNALRSRTDLPGRIATFRLLMSEEAYTAAASLVLQLPPGSTRPAEVRKLGEALRHLGELTQASRVLEHALSHRRDALLERLLAATNDEIGVLTGRSVPRVQRIGAMRPVKGRVLHVIGKSVPHFSSGYTIRTKYLVEAQRQIGIDAIALTEPGFPWSVGVEQATIEEVVDGVTYIRCPPADGETGADIDRMADIVRRVRPAVLHAASDFRNAVNALALGRAFGIPVIYEVRGIWEETWVSKRGNEAREREHFRLRKERETESARAADRVVTLSETLRAELINRGIQGDKITVVPNAVDADRFPVQERDHSLAAQWEIEPEDVTVGYISSLVSYEGVEYLIEAVADLRARGRRVRALVVGDGDQRENLEKHANDLGLEGGVVFTGRVPHSEILGYYGLIDIFVVPRTSARVCQLVTPLKPYEAMATGRAIVVSGVDALREIVEEGVTGLLFKPESSTDLAAAIDTLIEDPAMRARLGANAAFAVRQVHTWAANAKLYRDLYRDMGAL